MNYFNLALIIVFLSLSNIGQATEIKQETKGNQSPAIIGDRNTIIYQNASKEIEQTISELKETKQQLNKCLDIANNIQRQKLEELNQKLANLYIQQVGSSDDEARKWAKDLIEKAPDIKKQREEINKLNEQYNEEFSKDLLAKTYRLFAYIYERVDYRFQALQESNSRIKYVVYEKFDLFSEDQNSINPYVSRTAILKNGNEIRIILNTGKIQKGIISICPSLDFVEKSSEKIVQSFKVVPDIGGLTLNILSPQVQLPKKAPKANDVKYRATGEEMLTDEFKNRFTESFMEFINISFSR